MSGLKGIAKNLTTSVASHVVAVLQNVVLTPLFLRSYGIAGFGEWLTLSASVSYLGTLDFGIQTFVNQDLTVRYHRGDMRDFHVRQSTALRMLLGIVLAASLVAIVAFALPIEHWLKMDGSGPAPPLSAGLVRSTVFVLALQVLASILYGFVAGQFMVLGRAHIGGHFNNIKNVTMILAALPCVVLHLSFLAVAVAQLTALLVCMIAALATLYKLGRDIFPTLRYWDGSSVGKILGPSGYFAMIYSTNFLVFQMPVLILENGVGPVAVTIFSIARTIFSMTRNVMNAFSQAFGPEVTRLYAREDWPRLSHLYDYSERLVFALIPIANLGVLFLCPLLLTVWLHKPNMFADGIYVLCACVSIVISAKEHKMQFQCSTNTHRELARFTFVCDLALVAAWWVAVPRFGVTGLLWAWFASELSQALYIMQLNIRLFSGHVKLDVKYPIRLSLLSVALIAIALFTLPRIVGLPLVEQGAIAVGIGLLILALDIPLFELLPVWGSLRNLISNLI